MLNILLVLYVVVGALLYWLQDKLIMHPQKVAVDKPYTFSSKFRELNLDLDGKNNLNIVQFLPDEAAKGIILYFHGNFGNIGFYADAAPALSASGYEVWMIDYPGFGKTTGSFTEERVYADASYMYEMASSRFASSNIVIYGRSLGSGIAAWLAAKKSCKHLILETPYYSLASLAQRKILIYPAEKLLKYHFSTAKYIPVINAPVSVFHGTDDRIIPYSNVEKLLGVLQPKDEFISIPGGGHNNLASFPAFSTAVRKAIVN